MSTNPVTVADEALTLRIYYEDTDAGGVVYHANYLKFMERARTEFLRSHGIEQDQLLQQDLAFVVSNIEVDFCAPARFNDTIHVHSQISELKRASLRFSQQIFRADGQCCIRAEVRIAAVRLSDMRVVAIPEQVKGVLCGAR